MIIHVENTLRAMTCEMCGNYFMKKLKMGLYFWKEHEYFFPPVKKIKISDSFFFTKLQSLFNGQFS